jgi:hypothetical protein
MPWALRDTISMIDDCDIPQSSEPTEKTTRPRVNNSLRPYRSANEPAVSNTDASVRA